MSDSYILRHEQCPQCKKIGKDNGHDNLGIYSDGHTFCFSCGYGTSANSIKRFITKTTPESIRLNNRLVLPNDATTILPRQATEWLSTYGFNGNTIIRNHIMWSEEREMLLFPYFIEGELLGWQGRLFGADKAKRKWFSQGKLDDFIYTLGINLGSLVLVESIISAIKVSRVCAASPIFGSHISMERLLRINKFYDRIVIWLDPDKQAVALRAAQKARLLGLDVHTVIADMKPKDYTLDKIERYVNETGSCINQSTS